MTNSLQPVALNVTARFKALALAEAGYRQTDFADPQLFREFKSRHKILG